MTDGIVQQTIKSHMHIQDANESHCSECRKLERIQKELIEKIKQLSEKDYHSYYYHEICDCKSCLILRTLIGDNQKEKAKSLDNSYDRMYGLSRTERW